MLAEKQSVWSEPIGEMVGALVGNLVGNLGRYLVEGALVGSCVGDFVVGAFVVGFGSWGFGSWSSGRRCACGYFGERSNSRRLGNSYFVAGTARCYYRTIDMTTCYS